MRNNKPTNSTPADNSGRDVIYLDGWTGLLVLVYFISSGYAFYLVAVGTPNDVVSKAIIAPGVFIIGAVTLWKFVSKKKR